MNAVIEETGHFLESGSSYPAWLQAYPTDPQNPPFDLADGTVWAMLMQPGYRGHEGDRTRADIASWEVTPKKATHDKKHGLSVGTPYRSGGQPLLHPEWQWKEDAGIWEIFGGNVLTWGPVTLIACAVVLYRHLGRELDQQLLIGWQYFGSSIFSDKGTFSLTWHGKTK